MSEETVKHRLADYADKAASIIRKASISLLIDGSSDDTFYGEFISNLNKNPNMELIATRLSIDINGITLNYNPLFICRYYTEHGISAIINWLKLELNHLLLMHVELVPALMSKHTDYGKELSTLAMHLSAERYVQDIKYPGCPACQSLEWDENNPPAFANFMCAHTSDCRLFDTTRLLKSLSKNVSGSHDALVINDSLASLPTEDKEKVHEFVTIYKLSQIEVEASISDSLAQNLVISMVHHTMATKDFSPRGSIFSVFKQRSAPKPVPFILQFRGVLGAALGTAKEPTRYRPNRRFKMTQPGKKSVPKMKYVMAIDSSGSVDIEDVQEAIAELLALKQYSSKLECRVILFHSVVWADFSVENFDLEDFSNKFQIGGTSFDSVFKRVFYGATPEEQEAAINNRDDFLLCNTLPEAEKRAMLIIMTDGYCSINFPKKHVRGSVLWALTKDGTDSYIKRWDPDANIIRMD